MMDQISICKALAKRKETDPFLKRMVTGDEKWVTYDNIVRKRSCQNLYCQQLDRLKLAIDQKRPELAKRKGAFHQDNSRLHTSVVTCQKFWTLGWEVLMHPPFSPDLAPSELQNFLSDKKLGPRENCENRSLEFFSNEDQDFYERGIMKLPLKWQQIIQQNDVYLTQIGQSKTC
ncbi:histone-lysine N-methyltransferase SETMAR [Trichonephila clavipes]|nr:histone-lysine N-methyltransferase SETMAR [Trichonephila clavipes]